MIHTRDSRGIFLKDRKLSESIQITLVHNLEWKYCPPGAVMSALGTSKMFRLGKKTIMSRISHLLIVFGILNFGAFRD